MGMPKYSDKKKKNINALENRIENMATSKVSKEHMISEISRVEEQIDTVKIKLDNLDERSSSPHLCNYGGAFEMINARIESNKTDINANSQAIRKLYIWQATVGVSLLLFFLTVGVAALRYVDKIDFSVEKNTEKIERIENLLVKPEPKDEGLSEKKLKKILKDILETK